MTDTTNHSWEEDFLRAWNTQPPELFQIVEFRPGAEAAWRDSVEAVTRNLLASREAGLRKKVEGVAKKYETSSGARNALSEVLELFSEKPI